MEIVRAIEFDIEQDTHNQITKLRNLCFPENKSDRSDYKQLPHFRYLAFDNNLLIAHMGVDHLIRPVPRMNEVGFHFL